MRRLAVAASCALLLAPAAPAAAKPKLTKAKATAVFVSYPKVAGWLKHYPPKTRTTEATLSKGVWTVKVWTSIDSVGEVATGKVDDRTGAVTEAWTGPQVAWQMARGGDGAFGGRQINSARVWLGLCAVFLLGLASFRRPLSLRNLDLLVELKLVGRLDVGQGVGRYERLLPSGEHHHHLVCDRCGRVEEVALDKLEPFLEALKKNFSDVKVIPMPELDLNRAELTKAK